MRYRLSERAKGALKAILLEGLEVFGEIQALKYQDTLKRTFELLAYMPAIGRRSERDGKDEYKFPHGKHVIYYRVEQDEIVIENIVFGPTITDLWGDD